VRLLIAGGGTGGHLFPGIPLADEVRRRGGEVLFVGTRRGIEMRAVPAAGYALETLAVSGLKRMGLAATLRGLLRLPLALWRSFFIVRRFRPDVVVGVGGYASGPLVLAAVLSRVATAVQEQNSVPGITNRMLGRLVGVVFTAFDEAARFFPEPKLARLGNPTRRAIVAALDPPAGSVLGGGQLLASGALGAGQLRVLVVGGSQGARAVSELVVGAAALLARTALDFAIVHQTGAADLEAMRARYRELGLAARAEVYPFIDDMADAYRAADLVIARAGALTLAELAIVGKPAILIPLPTAADDHQTRNAAAVARAGAALLLDQRQASAADLASAIVALAQDRAKLTAMGKAMRELARPRAAELIVDRLQTLAERRRP